MQSLRLLALLVLASVASAQTRVNCGGPAYTGKDGRSWAADNSFTGGNSFSWGVPITGTNDAPLFQTQRWSSMSYSFPVSDGSYSVSLYFAEIYPGSQKVGARVFSVKINGLSVLSNFDVFAKVGANAADIETFPVTVAGQGRILIEFSSGNNPFVDAIEIVSSAPPPPLEITFPGCCTVSFPIASASQVPSCTPADGICTLQIQVCDTAGNCITGLGTLSIVKTFELPLPQTLVVPIAIANQEKK